MRAPSLKISLALWALLAALSGVVSADTHLEVDAGWGSLPHNGRWIPVFITASDSKTRNVGLDIEWPCGSYLMHIQQDMTIDATPRTFPLLLPVHGYGYGDRGATFSLIDAATHKTLARFPKDQGSPSQLFNIGYPDPSATFVGISGSPTGLDTLELAMGKKQNIGFLPMTRLPAVPLGYDAVDVLFLNAPNLIRSNLGSGAIDDEQQQAMVDWVRAGGKLILWPGDAGFPTTGPLADALPATIGAGESLLLDENQRKSLGLPRRFASIPSHHLLPRQDAEELPILHGTTSAYAIRLGLGRIVLAPLNMSGLQIDDIPHSRELWRPILKNIMPVPADDAPADNGFTDYSFGDSRDTQASTTIADFLGDVPGAGQISFSYVAYVLLGLMLVVGPVDWFVLRKLGRQPWTWVTTSGWIALVATGALFVGYAFKSGDLHYRTLRTIDQVDDQTIGSTDYVALYASRTRLYQIKPESGGWWQPGVVSEYSNSGLKTDIDFHQTLDSNIPEDMVVNVWSLRFLRGDHAVSAPPMIAADIHRVSGKIIGKITNLTDKPLHNIRVAVREGTGVCALYEIPTSTTASIGRTPCSQILPHTSVTIEAVDLIHTTPDTQEWTPAYGRSRYYGQSTPTTEPDLWKAAAGLNYRRGTQMADRVATGDSAIVYAETENPDPPASLQNQNAIERHWQFIRALVDLHVEKKVGTDK